MRVPEKRAGLSLPEYRRQSSYTAGSGLSARADDSFVEIRARAEEDEREAAGRFAVTAGRAVMTAAQAWDDYQTSRATQAFNAFQTSMQERMYGEDGIFTRQGEAAFSSAEDLETAMRESVQELSESMELNPLARVKLARQVFAFGNQALPRARKYAADQRLNWANGQDRASIELNQEAFLNNADDSDARMLNLNTMRESYERYAARNGLSGEEKTLGWKKIQSGAYGRLADKYISEGNLSAARRLAGEEALWVDGEQSRLWARITRQEDILRAQAEANRNKAVREILKDEQNALYLAERGDVSALEDMTKRLRASGATEEAKMLENQTAAFRESAQVLRSAAELSLPEAVKMLQELDVELDEALKARDVDRHRMLSLTRDVLTQQLSARTNDLQKNPAAAAEKALQLQPEQFQLPENASMEDRVAVRMDWQRKNGVSDPVPLTEQEVEDIAEQYGKMFSPGDFVAMLSEAFGGQSDAVLKQLMTSGKLPPDTNLALIMPRESANLLMQMNNKGAVREAERVLGVDEFAKHIIVRTARNELEDILGTLTAQGASSTADQVLEASYKLSLKYMERGMSAKDAGVRAAREVMADRYEVRDGYRVPRNYDADKVALGAKGWLKELVSSGTVAMNVVPGLTEAQTKEKKAAILISSGRWVNNADESGLLLTVNGAPILDTGGRPVQVMFEDLAAKGEEWRLEKVFSGPARGGNLHTVLIKK